MCVCVCVCVCLVLYVGCFVSVTICVIFDLLLCVIVLGVLIVFDVFGAFAFFVHPCIVFGCF